MEKLEILLKRGKSHADHNGFTIGEMFINGKHVCYTMEDEYRKVKVPGETRIPAGKYKIKLKTDSSKNGKYLKLFGKMHKGMLWLQDVPGFLGILIHIGNTEKDSEGCILVGTEKYESDAKIGNSTAAYQSIYPVISDAIIAGKEVTIEIVDFK